jgi:hypothetical protein
MKPEGSLLHSQKPASCHYAEPTQCSPYPHILLLEDTSLYCPPIYAWVSQVLSFLQVSPPKPCNASSLPNPSYMPRPSHSSRFYHPHNIGWGIQIMKLLIMKFSLHSCYLVPLRSKYSPQLPTLKHPQPTFLFQCQRPSFTPTQNNRKNYVSYILNFKFCCQLIEIIADFVHDSILVFIYFCSKSALIPKLIIQTPKCGKILPTFRRVNFTFKVSLRMRFSGYYALCSGNSIPALRDNPPKRFLNLEDCYPETSIVITTTRCVITQKSAVLIHFAAEVWNLS